MLGAIIGDIVGSVYEFNNIKTKDFPLFSRRSTFTDDSILSVATADWLLHGGESGTYYAKYANNFPKPMGAYGSSFVKWASRCTDRTIAPPYNSCGNGSAMRVGAVGWAFHTMEETLHVAQLSARCTHNHIEGIKGAQATALCVFMARNGASKEDIRHTIEDKFGYDLKFTCDSIRATYGWGATCQDTVPQAIVAFLDGNDFEDCIRNAVSIGGDSDTIGCITGSIAEAFYGVPQALYDKGLSLLHPDLKAVVLEFEHRFGNKIAKSNGYHRAYTPDMITSLSDNEIFVFGSNLQGMHGGGAARVAYERFGAVFGQGVGLQGKSYAIPTMQGGVETVKPYVDDFIKFAETHPEYRFLVTRIGCGIAGFKDSDIAPLFYAALDIENIILPQTFVTILNEIQRREAERIISLWKMGLGNSSRRFMGEEYMPKKEVVATADRWKTLPMSDQHYNVPLNIELPRKAFDLVRMGHIPEAMEDHWFMYCDDSTIRYYRSWTGLCIYIAEYELRNDKCVITELQECCDQKIYKSNDRNRDIKIFLALLTEEYGGDSSALWHDAL